VVHHEFSRISLLPKTPVIRETRQASSCFRFPVFPAIPMPVQDAIAPDP
jgi:hypothetical protein